MKVWRELNLWAIPRPRLVYHFVSTIEVGVEFGAPGFDPIVSVSASVKVADLPPATADLLNRVLP